MGRIPKCMKTANLIGKNWGGKLYFDPEVESKAPQENYIVSEKELQQKLEKLLLNDDEQILQLLIYKVLTVVIFQNSDMRNGIRNMVWNKKGLSLQAHCGDHF